MSDADTGAVLVLGGTSAIASAYARLCAAKGRPIVLAGRNPARLAAAAADLTARGASEVQVHAGDLADGERIGAMFGEITAATPDIGEVLLAYGVLGDMAEVKRPAPALSTHLQTNFLSAALWLEHCAAALEARGAGRIIVIGSVAGDRGRQSNYPYGAAKAGLERYVEGLQHRFALGGGRISTHFVKAGFVDSPMTEGMDKGGPLWATPDQVAQSIRRGVARGQAVLYVPWFWRAIMAVICAVPRFVFHKTRL
jgi:decaprenylphospho-beta-D-erythro-pentofuranosid-2-ulose 2-reductase